MSGGLKTLAAVVLVAGSLACASSGGGVAQERYRADLGRLLAQPLDDAVLKIFSKHTVPLYRTERASRSLLYESEWMPRDVTPAEATQGVTGARNRIVLRGRQVESEMDAVTGVFRVTFELQNEVRTEVNSDWHGAAIPDTVLESYRDVLTDLRMETRTGVRR